uniref:Uncharacterized protein n=1 Tax=Marseillevirus LCMAC101 TaxID=2506602 RepID=A0A481YSU9_9VIRU|nr:MAG: hypothetical protein LCMAC101_07440 [Marseillevirus LCMAC101]
MALVLREDIAKTLFRFGKRVEKEIREGKKLDILELNNLLRPTLETIESKAVSFATKEVEENISKNHDNTKKRKREEMCDRRRATLSESVMLETPRKRIRIHQGLASNISRLEGVTEYIPDDNLNCLSDSDILKYDTDDESWEEYFPLIEVNDEGENILCAGELDDLLIYLSKHARTDEDTLTILKSVKKKEILTYGYFLTGMIQLCKILIRKKTVSVIRGILPPFDEEFSDSTEPLSSVDSEDNDNEENYEEEDSDTSTESVTESVTETSS